MREIATFIGEQPRSMTTPRGLKPWTTYYVDTSNNNGRVDYRTIARHAHLTGITGAAMKASEGTQEVDDLFRDARALCAEVGLRVMAYHFARPDLHPGLEGASAEASHFCSVVQHVAPYEWRPMLDFETAPFDPSWAREWNNIVRERLGVAPVIYSYFSALAGMGLHSPLSDGLVLAYPNGMPRSAPVPPPWKRWASHQYSWHGLVEGVPGQVDLNWTPSVRALLAFPVRGAAYEPVFKSRRRKA